MSEENLFISDPSNYRKLSEPFPSTEATDAAIKGFAAELRELRNKYKLPDVYTVIRATTTLESGEEGLFFLSLYNGDDVHAEAMTAYALGYEQHRRQEKIAAMANGKTVKTRRHLAK